MSKKKSKTGNRLDHRGRFQAQGDGLEESESWAQENPLPKPDAKLLVDTLSDKLSPSDLEKREGAFDKCRGFIDKTPAVGLSPCKKSFFQDIKHRDIRVDRKRPSGV